MKRLSLFLGILFLICLLALSYFLKVKVISCQTSENTSCPPEINSELKTFEGTRLLSANRTVITILKSHSEVEKFIVTTSPFGNMYIKLTLRRPDIALKPSTDSPFTLYTKDGIVVGQSSQTTLPVVELKEQVDSKNIPFLVVLSYQLTTILPISTMSVEGSKLIVVLRDSRIVYYPLDGDVDVLLGATLATFSQLNLSEGKLIIDRQAVAIHEIDFRFKNPVLR